MSQIVEMFISEQIRHANLMKINSNKGVQHLRSIEPKTKFYTWCEIKRNLQ
jgi:hypothetical protein